MEFIINYWYLIVAALCFIACVIYSANRFKNMPTEEQIAQLTELLKFAVTEAEKRLGSKMGQMKLREVYSFMLGKLPWISVLISFEVFANYVDDALIWMRNEMESNEKFRDYINNIEDENTLN